MRGTCACGEHMQAAAFGTLSLHQRRLVWVLAKPHPRGTATQSPVAPRALCYPPSQLTSSGGHTLYRYEACLCRRHDGAVLAFRTHDGHVAPAGVRLPGCGAAAPAPALRMGGGMPVGMFSTPAGGVGGCCFFDDVRLELERAAGQGQPAMFAHAAGAASVAVRLEHVDGVEGRRLAGERSCLLSAAVPLERGGGGGGGGAAEAMRQLQNCVWTVANLVAWQ